MSTWGHCWTKTALQRQTQADALWALPLTTGITGTPRLRNVNTTRTIPEHSTVSLSHSRSLPPTWRWPTSNIPPANRLTLPSPMLTPFTLANNTGWGWEGWRDGSEIKSSCGLTEARRLDACGVQPHRTPVPGDLMLSSSFSGYQAHTWSTKHTHTYKIKSISHFFN